MYYKLIDAIDVPKNLSVVTRKGSTVRYGKMRLEPGKKYEIPEDETLFNAIKNATETTRYTPEREEALKACHANYEKKVCKSCGGKVLKLVYHVVEVVNA